MKNKRKIMVRDVKFGKNVSYVDPVNIYGCEIGDHTFIGPFVEIQKDVIIGSNCKIQSHTFICEKVKIGNNVFIAHGVIFVNDLFSNGKPAGGNKDLWKDTKVGDNVSIGSNSTILPVEICDYTVIGAGSVVTKNITVAGVYAGNPAKLLSKIV